MKKVTQILPFRLSFVDADVVGLLKRFCKVCDTPLDSGGLLAILEVQYHWGSTLEILLTRSLGTCYTCGFSEATPLKMYKTPEQFLRSRTNLLKEFHNQGSQSLFTQNAYRFFHECGIGVDFFNTQPKKVLERLRLYETKILYGDVFS